jgi:hypothetical protein
MDDENRDSTHGIARRSYAIWVRFADASAAAELVERQLESGDLPESSVEGEPWGGVFESFAQFSRGNFARPEMRLPAWPQLAAFFVAGGLVAYGGQMAARAFLEPQGSGHSSDLSQALEALPRPLATSPDEAGARVVLRSDRGGHAVWLEEDFDGDGQADSVREFRGGRLISAQRR